MAKIPVDFFTNYGMGLKDVGIISGMSYKYLNMPSNSYGIFVIIGYTDSMSMYMARAQNSGVTEYKAILQSEYIDLTPETNKIKITNNANGSIRILVASNVDFTLT